MLSIYFFNYNLGLRDKAFTNALMTKCPTIVYTQNSSLKMNKPVPTNSVSVYI